MFTAVQDSPASPHDEDCTSRFMTASHSSSDAPDISERRDISASTSPFFGTTSAATAPLLSEPGINDESLIGSAVPLSTDCSIFYPPHGVSPYFHYWPSSFIPVYFLEPPPS